MDRGLEKRGRLRKRMSLGVNALIFALVLYAWCIMFFRLDESGQLSTTGLWSLKYFTVLSNLLMGLASLVWVIALLRGKPTRGALVLKYAGTVSVALTLLTVFIFLGPLFGYGGMFLGANLYMHLIVPLIALADFLLLCQEGELTRQDALWATSPMPVYGLGYMANVLVHGVGEYPSRNDFYGFFTWGGLGAAVIAVVMVVGTWGLARGLRALRSRATKIDKNIH